MKTTIAERNALIEKHREQIRLIAQRIVTKLPPGATSSNELLSAGVLGLIEAIAHFEPERGFELMTFAAPRIRGAMLDELRSQDPMSRNRRAKHKTYCTARDSLAADLGRTPSDEEIAERLQLSPAEFKTLWEALAEAGTKSLSAHQFETDSGRSVQTIHTLQDAAAVSPQSRLQKEDLRALVTRGLNREERLIVTLYYYEELTMKEIGQVLGLSESRVSQMHSAIVEFLRLRLSERRQEFI